MIKVRILQVCVIRLIPRWFSHCFLSPLLKIEHIVNWSIASGISAVSQQCSKMRRISGFSLVELEYFNSSIEITSVQVLWFFAFFKILFNSSIDGFASSSQHVGLGYKYDIATPHFSTDQIWVYKMLHEPKSKINYHGKPLCFEKMGPL